MRARTEARATLDAACSEKDFQAAVIDLARLCGWKVYHTHDSRRSPCGFPDLFLVRGDRVVVLELKTMHGRLTDDQRAWLDALKRAGIDAWLVRPSDWEWIVATLRRDA